jgi:hypothetical protein
VQVFSPYTILRFFVLSIPVQYMVCSKHDVCGLDPVDSYDILAVLNAIRDGSVVSDMSDLKPYARGMLC